MAHFSPIIRSRPAKQLNIWWWVLLLLFSHRRQRQSECSIDAHYSSRSFTQRTRVLCWLSKVRRSERERDASFFLLLFSERESLIEEGFLRGELRERKVRWGKISPGNPRRGEDLKRCLNLVDRASEQRKDLSWLTLCTAAVGRKRKNQGKTVEPADGRDGLEIAQIKPNHYFYAWLFVRALPCVLCFL